MPLSVFHAWMQTGLSPSEKMDGEQRTMENLLPPTPKPILTVEPPKLHLVTRSEFGFEVLTVMACTT